MPDQDIFSAVEPETKEEENTTPQETPAPRTDELADKLKSIVNENGEPKYKDVPTALDALVASQEFIKKLQEEKRASEEEKERIEKSLKERESVESLLEKVTKPAQPQSTPETPTTPEGLSVEAVKKMVEETLLNREQQASQENNLKTVISSLSEKYGDQAAAQIKNKASELGISVEDLRTMSKTTPKVVLGLFGAASKSSDTPTLSSTSTQLRPGTQPLERPTVERGKGVAHGGLTDKQLVEMFKKSTEYTNKRLKIGD